MESKEKENLRFGLIEEEFSKLKENKRFKKYFHYLNIDKENVNKALNSYWKNLQNFKEEIGITDKINRYKVASFHAILLTKYKVVKVNCEDKKIKKILSILDYCFPLAVASHILSNISPTGEEIANMINILKHIDNEEVHSNKSSILGMAFILENVFNKKKKLEI